MKMNLPLVQEEKEQQRKEKGSLNGDNCFLASVYSGQTLGFSEPLTNTKITGFPCS